jgi:Flp pilus assembly pilin Flp
LLQKRHSTTKAGKDMMIAKILHRLRRDEKALAAVEYAFLCGLIVIVMVASLNTMANAIGITWTNISNQTHTAVQQATAA